MDLTALAARAAALRDEPDLSGEEAARALDETVAYLASDAALEAIALDPYWPKWDGPWWRMTLLWELGLAARIPGRAARALSDALGRHYLRRFPVRASEIPDGIDPTRHIACHCQLGTGAQLLAACGIDVAREHPWIEEWFARYQLSDGGLNCDETAYTRPAPRSSIVSTLPPAEAVLGTSPRPLGPAARRFLERVARYLGARRLLRSPSRGMALMHPRFLVPCFPRFYEYDVLRGLSFLAEYAPRAGSPLPRGDVEEAVLTLDRAFADGPGDDLAPRRSVDGTRTIRHDAGSRSWRRGELVATFPLLEVAARPDVGGRILAREYRRAMARLARPGVVE